MFGLDLYVACKNMAKMLNKQWGNYLIRTPTTTYWVFYTLVSCIPVNGHQFSKLSKSTFCISILILFLFRNFIQGLNIFSYLPSATKPTVHRAIGGNCNVWFGCSISISKGAFISACTNLLKRLLSFPAKAANRCISDNTVWWMRGEDDDQD